MIKNNFIKTILFLFISVGLLINPNYDVFAANNTKNATLFQLEVEAESEAEEIEENLESAKAADINFTITAKENGSASVYVYVDGSYKEAVSVNAGETKTVKIPYGSPVSWRRVPDAGYTYGEWYYPDTGKTGGTSQAVSSTGVRADMNVEANFTLGRYNISAVIHQDGGRIIGNGVDVTEARKFKVSGWEDATVQLIPDEGYEINAVRIDGKLMENPVGTYVLENITTSHSVWVSFEQKDVTVNFDIATNGGEGTPPASQTLKMGDYLKSTSIPVKTGWRFIGWYSEPVGGTQWNFMTDTMGSSDMTLYAHFVQNEYKVNFDLNGGEGTAPVTQTLKMGDLVSDPGAASKAGYTFVGWFTAATGGTQWNFTSDKVKTSDITLYAQYEANKYNVSFNLNSGSGIAPVTQ
ncbi:MAG: InlB B-repeat-containing protein, partial [Erysipelotrichaceae bacterium]